MAYVDGFVIPVPGCLIGIPTALHSLGPDARKMAISIRGVENLLTGSALIDYLIDTIT